MSQTDKAFKMVINDQAAKIKELEGLVKDLGDRLNRSLIEIDTAKAQQALEEFRAVKRGMTGKLETLEDAAQILDEEYFENETEDESFEDFLASNVYEPEKPVVPVGPTIDSIIARTLIELDTSNDIILTPEALLDLAQLKQVMNPKD